MCVRSVYVCGYVCVRARAYEWYMCFACVIIPCACLSVCLSACQSVRACVCLYMNVFLLDPLQLGQVFRDYLTIFFPLFNKSSCRSYGLYTMQTTIRSMDVKRLFTISRHDLQLSVFRPSIRELL